MFRSAEGSGLLLPGAAALLALLSLGASAPAAEAPSTASSPAAPAGVRLVRSSAAEAVIEVDAPDPTVGNPDPDGVLYQVEGWAHTYDQGSPELPSTGFVLALPPGTRAELESRVVESGALSGAAPAPVPRPEILEGKDGLPVQNVVRRRDPDAYARPYPAEWARLGGESGLRHLRTIGIEVFPYRWDPSASLLRIAHKLEITVRFVPDARAKSMERGEALPAPDGEIWDRVYRRTVLNAADAGSFRRSPTGWQGSAPKRLGSSEQEFLIRVDRTDLYRIPFDSLAAHGWNLGSVPIDQLALVERFYREDDPDNPFHELEVPIKIRDLNDNGLFDSGEPASDEIVFFGQTIWDDSNWGKEHASRHPLAKDRRYGRENAYFLTVRPGEGGARMGYAGSSHLGRTDLVPETSFPWTERFEGEGVYMVSASKGPGQEQDSPYSLKGGVDDIQSEHFFWVGGDSPTEDRPTLYPVPFDLPGFVSPVGLTMKFHGISRTDNFGTPAHVRFTYVRAPGDTMDVPWPTIIVPSQSGAAATFGPDQLRPVPWKRSGNELFLQSPTDSFGAALDWMQWTWVRDYSAQGNRVAWTTGSVAGVREFALTGFSTESADSLLLFDVTDSVLTSAEGSPVKGPRWLSVDPAVQVTGPARDRKLTLQMELNGTPRVFLGLAASSVSLPKSISPVSSVDLTRPEGRDEDLVVITAPQFVDGLGPLVDLRRQEGLSVRVASVRDVFNQFEGGRAWPTAIRSYLRYLFRTRDVDPSFLLLVGDASDDFANVLSSSAPDYVPSQTVFSWAYADQGSELVASDEWFVDRLTGTGDSLDFVPDMAVGRLAVGDQEELSAVVDKLVHYARFAPADVWRSRGLFVADDDFSNRIGFSGNYTFYGDRTNFQGGESIFRWGSRAAMKRIRDVAGFTEFAADSFFTAAYMDTVPGLQRCCDWATGHCATQDFHLQCYSSGALPYFTTDGQNHPHSDNGYYGMQYVRPQLRTAMSRGYLLVNFQGHANAHLMTHEYIFVDQRFNPPNDPLELRNEYRPFVFAGFGCHLAEFSSFDEGMGNRGDGIAERLLLQPGGRGAVASYASTGYEWLQDNNLPDANMIDAWFVDPPQVDGETRWILGEVITAGKILMYGGRSGDQGRMGPVATYTLLGDPSMPMEMAPPRLNVTLNGEPWTEGRTVAAEEASDTLRVRVDLKDEVHLSDVSILDAGVPVPDSLYSLVEADSTAPGADRRLLLVYNTPLHVSSEDYDIKISARDRNGQETAADLVVHTGATFQVVRAGIPSEIHPRDVLEGLDTLRILLTSPVDLTREELQVLYGDTPLSLLAANSSDRRNWEIRAVLPSELGTAEQRIRLRISGTGAPDAEKSVLISSSTEVHLSQVYNFPNPFTGETQIFYTLSRTALSTKIGIYTQSGRKIWSGEGPALVNENSVLWDGRDDSGDPVANGLYLYKIEVRTPGGKTVSRIEKMARVR